jgi:uncharacterized protein YecT (DUF1311 family)
MNLRYLPYVLAALSSLAAGGAHAGECDDPKSSEQIAQCLGMELRESDARINASYKELMGKLGDSDKTDLRQAQRAWIRERDSVCQLDTRESNRERWYQALLKDYAKTVCITRYTRRRTAELDNMLAKPAPPEGNAAASGKPPAPVPPVDRSDSEVAFDKRPATVHTSGKWYFEMTVNYSEAVKIEPCVLSVGVTDKQQFIGLLDNIRPKHADKDIMRYGFAIDLDNGKLYISKNGEWTQGAPGSNLGQDLKLGRTYYASFMSSADSVAPYLEHKAFAPNFGDKPMTYALPAGYSPWRNNTAN